MTTESLDQIMTKKMKQERDKKIAEKEERIYQREQQRLCPLVKKLEKIIRSESIRNLADMVKISSYRIENGSDYKYGKLYLTNEGLKEKKGYERTVKEGPSMGYDGWSGWTTYSHDDKIPKNVPIEDFVRIIEDYSISKKDLDKLQSKVEELQ